MKETSGGKLLLGHRSTVMRSLYNRETLSAHMLASQTLHSIKAECPIYRKAEQLKDTQNTHNIERKKRTRT